jgi:hypothetical protein
MWVGEREKRDFLLSRLEIVFRDVVSIEHQGQA